MASTPKEESDREDGEIVEDEFEDISDNSIILTTAGKCFSPKEHLPEISLSSVSEAEDTEKCKQQRYRMQRSRRTHRKRKYSHRKTICLDSDSDEYVELDRKLLRAAIHIDNPDSLKNSLHTRLKAMTQTGDDFNKNNENDHQPLEMQSHNVSSDDGDDDLIKLRLEALRTAVLNKFKHRKKIKCKEVSESDGFEDIFTDIEKIDDKENEGSFNNKSAIHQTEVTNQDISPKSQSSVDKIVQNNPQEEDEDVLRALLLASLSKKISKESNLKSCTLQPSNEDIYAYNKAVPQNDKNSITNPYKKTTVMNKKNLPLQHTKVQPIIININCDSDTDEECHNFSKLPQNIPNPTIENSVEKFLKEQRAKVEAGNLKNNVVKSDFFNKSSLKLLPKIKQIEYHNLLKKLKDAQKLKLIQKKTEGIVTDSKLTSNSVYVENNVDHKRKFLNAKKGIRNKDSQINPEVKTQLEQIPDLRNEVRLLHKVLKEIQTNKCERLQMQTKYMSLTPIVRKINEASMERKKNEKEIERILGELSEAKMKLRETHLSISSHVKELIIEKEEIDKKTISIPDPTTNGPYTSTPVKDCTIVQADITDSKMNDCGTEINDTENFNNKEHKYSQTSATVPKYISPLDSVERLDMDDPFLIMCPYDIDGNCRDPECVYKHYRN